MNDHLGKLTEVLTGSPSGYSGPTRVVLVDRREGGEGRVFDKTNVEVDLNYQDDGRTLKIFVTDGAKPEQLSDELDAPNKAFMHKYLPSPELAAIVGEERIQRTEVTKRIWAYIKKHGLQDPAQRRMIRLTDSKMYAIFNNGKKKPLKAISMFEMTKVISQHLTP